MPDNDEQTAPSPARRRSYADAAAAGVQLSSERHQAAMSDELAETEEDELFLFQESLRRGQEAQTRRRRLLARPRISNSNTVREETYDDQRSLLTEQINWASARSLYLRNRLNDSSIRMTSTTNDPAPSRSHDSQETPQSANEFSDWPANDPQLASSVTASDVLAAQLNRPPPPGPGRSSYEPAVLNAEFRSAATSAARRRLLVNENWRRQQSGHAPAEGKPVLLLYCEPLHSAAQHIASDQVADEETPEGWYSVVDIPLPARSEADAPKRASIFDPAQIGGGGCGRLLCARASACPDTSVFESDTSPPAEAVGWVEPAQLDASHAPSVTTNTCSCAKAYMACRSCGNGIGYAVLRVCKLCSRNSCNPHKWVYSAAAVSTRPRMMYSHPPLMASAYPPHLAQAACEAELVMRWIPSALPTRDEDRRAGWAGDDSDWRDASIEAVQSADDAEPPVPQYARRTGPRVEDHDTSARDGSLSPLSRDDGRAIPLSSSLRGDIPIESPTGRPGAYAQSRAGTSGESPSGPTFLDPTRFTPSTHEYPTTGRRRRRRSLSPAALQREGTPETRTPAQRYADSIRQSQRRRRLLDLLREDDIATFISPSLQDSTGNPTSSWNTREMVGR